MNNNVEQDIQIQSANDENREASKDVVTKSPNVPIESVMSNSSLTTESTHVDDNFILQMAGLSTHDKVDGKKLEVYEKSVGFLYGERFSMTEESWADTEISVIRLRFSDELQDETANYVLHPCLIDACTKAILSLELQKKELTGSSESSGRSLPIGKYFELFAAYNATYILPFTWGGKRGLAGDRALINRYPPFLACCR